MEKHFFKEVKRVPSFVIYCVYLLYILFTALKSSFVFVPFIVLAINDVLITTNMCIFFNLSVIKPQYGLSFVDNLCHIIEAFIIFNLSLG